MKFARPSERRDGDGERGSPKPSGGPRTWALVAALTCVAAPRTASAQEPSKADLARARDAFREGVAFAAADNCVAALAKYKEVARVKMTPQVAFNTAECEARLGKLVSALGNYRIATSQAADDARAAAVLTEAPARVEALVARIPRLTVTRARSAETASIELDGTELGESQLGKAIPVDPGTHTIVARVGNKETLRETVKLEERQAKTFEVRLGDDAPAAEPPVRDTPATGAGDEQDRPKPVEEKSRAPGVALTVTGGVAMIVGLAMLAPRASAVAKLDADCTKVPDANGNRHCPVADAGTESSANLFTGLTAGFVGVGTVLAVTGIALIAKSGPAKPKPTDTDEKKGDDAKKEDAFLRSIEIVPGALGASIGGASIVGRF